MYQAKEQGRNNFKFFAPSMHEEILRYHGIENDLRKGIAEQQFELLYQPQVSFADYRVHAVEALLRWNHPTRGLVSPDEFISVAEESGYIVPLGLWVLDEACRQLKQWKAPACRCREWPSTCRPFTSTSPTFTITCARH